MRCAVTRRTAASTAGWTEVPPIDLPAWNRPLYEAGVPLWQLPYWQAFLERRGVRTCYLVHREQGVPRAWACVPYSGGPGFRLGHVQDGPVNLDDAARPVPGPMVAELCALCRRRGFVFLRIRNDEHQLSSVRALPQATAGDLFPFFRRAGGPELAVPLVEDENEMLRGFDWRARNAIKRAERAGFEVLHGDSDELLDQAYDLLVTVARRKGFGIPPRPRLAETLRRAEDVDGARLYVARRPDGVPVAGIFVAGDRWTSHYICGATDPDRLTGSVSPAALVHWTAMRHAAHRGRTGYNLGELAPPSVGQFKRRFRPVEVPPSPAVTVGLRPVAVATWRHGALPTLRRAWPAIQRARFRSSRGR
jgi:GNAT acetyltransferase-like protein